ncbi:MAG: SoxR reducing system RseC family protein [Spirochaetales bacterium]|nr:SoxR reducing system RseC family protein [Spirochaetales bacterium]
MTEQGIVRKIEGDLVWIAADQCGGCDHGLHCRSCASPDADTGNSDRSGGGEHSIFAVRKERMFVVRNTRSLVLKTGDRIEYFIAPVKAVKAGFLVLIVPILAFFLFYYLTGLLWKGSGENARVLAGVGGIALGFLVNFASKKRIREYPEITRVIDTKL